MRERAEQRFYSKLKDTFVGEEIKGESGYVNLMNLRQQYFDDIEPFIKESVEQKVEGEAAKEELYDKLYTFFDAYLNETGTVFFADTQLHKNLYERVYSDRDDVSLFWKTQKLYYVKSEALYDDLETEIEGMTFKFDASALKHAKGNEKKQLEFYLTDIENNKLTFKPKYREQNSYDHYRLHNDEDAGSGDIKNFIYENYPHPGHPNVKVINNALDHTVFTKTEFKSIISVYDIQDAVKSAGIEFAPYKVEHILKYFDEKQIPVNEDQLRKAFRIYKKQNEVDYFIHKDAGGFLTEQFNIYLYNYLFNDRDTQFNEERVKQIQTIKEIAGEVIDYIACFEDELKAIWNKPKFVRNSHYVLTLDRLADDIDLVKKIIHHENFNDQLSEYKQLSNEWQNDEGETVKRAWSDFAEISDLEISNIILDDDGKEYLNDDYRNLPIDTKYFDDLRYDILGNFESIDSELDGWLVKSDNYQALQTLKRKYRNEVQSIYADPPFNKSDEADYLYKVKYKDSIWLNLLENRIGLSREFLKSTGTCYLRCDYNGNMYARQLLDKILGKDKFVNEILVQRGRNTAGSSNKLETTFETLFLYSLDEKGLDKIKIKRSLADIKWTGFLMPGDRHPRERIFMNKELEPRKGQHYALIQEKVDKLLDEKFLRIKHRKTGAIYYQAENTYELNKYMKRRGNRFKFYDIDETTEYYGIEDLNEVNNHGSDENFMVQYLGAPDKFVDNNWTDISGYTNTTGFKTENAEILLDRAIKVGTGRDGIIMDYFLGSGTTTAVAHKLGKKWIGIDQGEHFYKVIIPRMKRVLLGHQNKVSRNNNFEGGGFFKYYELEQYEEALARSEYNQPTNQPTSYTFGAGQKQLEAISLDYEQEKAHIHFKKLYENVDIAETLSNLTGKKIRRLNARRVEFEDGQQIVFDEMTFGEYPWVKPLIWWNSRRAERN